MKIIVKVVVAALAATMHSCFWLMGCPDESPVDEVCIVNNSDEPVVAIVDFDDRFDADRFDNQKICLCPQRSVYYCGTEFYRKEVSTIRIYNRQEYDDRAGSAMPEPLAEYAGSDLSAEQEYDTPSRSHRFMAVAYPPGSKCEFPLNRISTCDYAVPLNENMEEL